MTLEVQFLGHLMGCALLVSHFQCHFGCQMSLTLHLQVMSAVLVLHVLQSDLHLLGSGAADCICDKLPLLELHNCVGPPILEKIPHSRLTFQATRFIQSGWWASCQCGMLVEAWKLL